MIDSVFWRRALAACVLAWGAAAHSALPQAAQQDVQRRLDCYGAANPSACEITLADSGTPFGRVHRGSALLLGVEVDAATRARAMEDLRSAAAEGYTPAYESLAVFLRRGAGRSESLQWRWLAAEHGHAAAAKHLGGSIDFDGTDRQSAADRMFLSWVHCHPASFDSDGPVMSELNTARKASPGADLAQVIAQVHAKRLNEAKAKAENFLHGCVPGAYYLASLPPDDQAWVRKTVRARMAQTLKNIQAAVRKFPDLELLTLPEYQDLLPPP
ncbi:TPR repeat protein [Variovorax boronicumulans]|uniref:TPR repeat protein n=1 Tax=Variovorax boronicumulans TaxID=436515 RepID=A0AAW8DY58_9BURK|nr:hypothetical protein [Variovorax boronicumulans]MDP9879591.1 TPR repeat protein [Variovorax boronicumulans]MDP9924731.1 TPR repeat protein [Variovorax boronicumulans]